MFILLSLIAFIAAMLGFAMKDQDEGGLCVLSFLCTIILLFAAINSYTDNKTITGFDKVREDLASQVTLVNTLGGKYRGLKAEYDQLVVINKKLRGEDIVLPQTEGKEVVGDVAFEEPVPYIEPPRQPKLLSLEMYEKLETLTGKCKSADNKLLALMSERKLLSSDFDYINNLVIECTAFDLRTKLEKGE